MSLTGDREDIATALSGVAGVNAYATRPKAIKAGDAWPLLGPLDRAEGLTFTATWRVFVVLPKDEVKASEWLDSHVEDLVDGLIDVGFVDTITPVELATEAGPLLALEITMRSE